MPTIPELERPLRDEQVVVRLTAERDIPEILIAHQDDPLLRERLGLERSPSGAELGREMERAEAERARGSRVRLTILEPGSDDCRGQIDVHDIDWANRRAAARIWVAPKFRGQGLEHAALALVARWLLDECGLEVHDA